jgi:putative ABC transport system permease protein
MPFAEVQTMDELVEQQTGGQRLTTLLLVGFAAGGVVGIYGVIAFLVSQQKQELAVRIAMGATPAAALWLVLKQGLGMAATGAAIGLLGASAAQKLIRGLLFGIPPLDPVTFAGGAAFLVAIAAVASAIPCASVMRLDPARTLRRD